VAGYNSYRRFLKQKRGRQRFSWALDGFSLFEVGKKPAGRPRGLGALDMQQVRCHTSNDRILNSCTTEHHGWISIWMYGL
jgi:hypothetical protein